MLVSFREELSVSALAFNYRSIGCQSSLELLYDHRLMVQYLIGLEKGLYFVDCFDWDV